MNIVSSVVSIASNVCISIIIIIKKRFCSSKKKKKRGVKKSLKLLPKGLKKSLKSLPRRVRKAANNIKHYKTTADSVPEWLTLYGDDEGPNTEKRS